MKTLIEITGCITKDNESEFTEYDENQFFDDFIDLIESKGWSFGGSITAMSEEDYLKVLNDDK